MIKPPAMTARQIAEYPDPAPPVRVSCYQHGCTLFVGDELPPGGSQAVAEAAGCPSWDSTDPAVFAGCPVPARLNSRQPIAPDDVQRLPQTQLRPT